MQITRGVSQWVKKNPESHRADRHIYYTPNSCTSSGGGITYYVNKLFFSLFLLLTFAFLFLFFFDWFFWLAKDLHRFAVGLCGPVAVGHFLIYQWPGQKRQSIEQSHSLIKCKHLFNCHASMQTAQLGAAFNGAWQFCQVNRIIRDAHKRKANKTSKQNKKHQQNLAWKTRHTTRVQMLLPLTSFLAATCVERGRRRVRLAWQLQQTIQLPWWLSLSNQINERAFTCLNVMKGKLIERAATAVNFAANPFGLTGFSRLTNCGASS